MNVASGAARSAIGVDRCGVGEHAVDVLVNVGDRVDAGKHEAVKDGRDAGGRGREVGAEVGPDLGAQPHDGAVLHRRHLDVLDVIAAVNGGAVVLAAALGPLHRPVQHLRCEDGHRVLGIMRDLAAEPSADLRCDDPDLLLRCARVERDQEAGDVRVLRTVHDLTAWPSMKTMHAPHWLVSQPTFVPVRPRVSRRK
jgi:hypothetical protein